MTITPLDGHPLLTGSAIRALEARGLAATPPGTLMDRAALAVADACTSLLRMLPARTSVLALAGPGNNGGDALLAGLRLAERGFAVSAVALAPDAPAAGDALRAREAWRAAGRPLAPLDDARGLDALLADAPLLIDGLFGIGIARPLPRNASALVARLLDRPLATVCVDVPSGLDADRGTIVGGPGAAAFRADVTVTMIADKPGLRTGAGTTHAGRIVVADLGLPALGIVARPFDAPADGPLPWGRLTDAAAGIATLPPARVRDAHKGRFGDVLVVAGAPSMQGASTLALLGARATGSGRLYLGFDAPAEVAPPPDAVHPEFMRRDLRTGDDRLGEAALGPATAVVVGCGLGRDARARRLLVAALAHPAPLVVDADALNLLAADGALFERLAARAPIGWPTVLTPHPLEAARLLGAQTADVQHDRIGSACRLAAASGACIVLKGVGTVVALPDASWSVNGSGGPILAAAGTGDVLAGAIAGLLAGGVAPARAAVAGVWAHGAAGDALAALPEWRAGIGLPASRLADAIRAVVNRRADRC